MSHIVDNYKHYMGSHCSSTLISNVLKYNGLDISEELCFGIGAGLGFVYRKAFNPPLYFVLGRADDIEEKVMYCLGGMAIPYTTDNDQTAWKQLTSSIDHGNPAIINVDASCLEYLRKKFNLFDHVRYGGHRVLVLDYCNENKTVTVADYLWSQYQTVSIENLQNARSSQDGQMSADNLMYTLLLPGRYFSIKDAIISGIRMNVKTMSQPWFDLIGLSGVGKFCDRVLTWPRLMKEEDIKKNAYMVYMMLEVVGTGGGNFRRLYARFLREANEYLGSKTIRKAIEVYSELGRLWKEVALLFKISSEDVTKGIWAGTEKNKILLEQIKKYENNGIMLLQDYLNE